MVNINKNGFIITLIAVVIGLIVFLFGKQCQKTQCPMAAKGMHTQKTHCDMVFMWKSDEMVDAEMTNVSIDTLSGKKLMKAKVKKKTDE